ncbi:MAG: NAD(P)/FAD-dependent oxidoreductase [Acidimicrobiales bacterium]
MVSPVASTDPAPAGDRPHVVVVGGGFAGLAVARGLAKGPVLVTIIDAHNFHTFSPLLYQVATAGLEPADVAYPIRTVFGHSPNVRFRHARVASVDTREREVELDDGAGVSYDHLVVATGATAAFFSVPGAHHHALPLYTLGDARRLRNRLLLSLEAADVAAQGRPLDLTYVVVGGGPTGVETAGALSELISIAVRRDGLRLERSQVRVVVVDLADRLLTSFSASASRYAARELARLGVEVQLGRSVVEVEEHALVFADGERLATTAVVWAAGVTVAGTLASDVGRAGPGARVVVGPDLRVPGGQREWVVGDAAAVLSEGEVCPQLAPVAIQSGQHCARQILRAIEGESTESFHYRDKGVMATIGRRAAVAQLPRAGVVKGTLGWLAWLGLHLFYLVGFRNRLRVLINWTWRYFDWPSGPRLIVADAETVD